MHHVKSITGRLMSRPRHGTVIAYLALFVAIGGSAVAAGIAQKNSVTSKSIKNGAVKSADVGDNSLSGSDINESSLGQVPSAAQSEQAQRANAVGPNGVNSAAIADNSVTASEIADDAVGRSEVAENAINGAEIAEGAIGAAEIRDGAITHFDISPFNIDTEHLSTGSVGAEKLKSVTAVVGQGTAISAGNAGDATVTCPGNTRLIAGGYAWNDSEANSVIYSTPSDTNPNRAWVVRGLVPTGSNTLFAWASCLAV